MALCRDSFEGADLGTVRLARLAPADAPWPRGLLVPFGGGGPGLDRLKRRLNTGALYEYASIDCRDSISNQTMKGLYEFIQNILSRLRSFISMSRFGLAFHRAQQSPPALPT